MTFKEFRPSHYITTDDGDLLHIMLSYSKDQGCLSALSAFSAVVDPHTGRYLGNVVESRLRAGFNGAPCFERHRKRYYLSWLKSIPKKFRR